jgi:hypothetical protein
MERTPFKFSKYTLVFFPVSEANKVTIYYV